MPDIPGDSSTTSSVVVGSTVNGSIEVGGDHDWFRITLFAGQQVSVALNGINANALEDPYIRIRDASGAILFENDDGGPGRNALVGFKAPTDGTYFLDVAAWDDATGSYKYTGDYQLKVSQYSPPPVGTLQQIADQLTTGYWNGVPHHFAVTPGGSITVNITGLTSGGQSLAREALHQWSDVIGVSFAEVATGGQIVFDDNEVGASTSAIYSGGIETSAHVNVSTKWITDYGSSVGTYGFQTFLHEIGHALGLGHSGDYDGAARYPYDALFLNDAWSTSVMSYYAPRETSSFSNFSNAYLGTPMAADILAMSQLYGLSTATRLGNTTYGFNATAGNSSYNAALYPGIAYTVFDSGGNDTLDYSGFGQDQTIDLASGTFSNVGGLIGNVSIAIGTLIENAIGGSGNDTIRGNEANNVLLGNAGIDRLFGLAGNDILTGGAGADQLVGGAGADTFRDTAAGLNGDTIYDFSAEDRIVISDASISGFTYSLAGITLSYTGGSLSFGTVPTSPLFAYSVTGGGVSLSQNRILLSAESLKLADFGTSAAAGGWASDDRYPRLIADVNGDGRADIVAFGNDGVFVSLGTSSGTFALKTLVTPSFGAAATSGGWFSNNVYLRVMADVNGDGRADIVGFGNAGTYVSLGTTTGGFGQITLVTPAFGAAASSGGWYNNDLYLRQLADVNGDGRADVVGFGNAGVYVSLATADGTFATPIFGLNQFGVAADAGGWASDNITPRELADVNGDHKLDVVGFGNDGVYIALGNGDGTFGPALLDLHAFGALPSAGGWTSAELYPRHLADVNHDGSADVVGFFSDGVHVALSGIDLFT